MSDDKLPKGMTVDELAAFDGKADLYILGQLTPEDEQSFRESVMGNKELKKRLLTLVMLYKAIRKVGRERDARLVGDLKDMPFDRFMERVYRNVERAIPAASVAAMPAMLDMAADCASTPEPAKPAGKKVGIYRQLVRWCSVAAVVVLLCWGGYRYYRYDRRMDLFDNYYAAYDAGISRGLDSGTEAELKALFDAIDTGKDLESNLVRLEKCYALAQGTAYTPYTIYSDDIAWYLALAYLKAGQSEYAIDVLKKLADENAGEAIGERANELIHKIEKLH